MTAQLGNLAILGSTGSIGRQTLEVLRANQAQFRVIALTAYNNIKLLVEQAKIFHPQLVVVGTEASAKEAKAELGTSCEVLWGEEALCQAVALESVHTVVGGIVGFACLKPVFAAIKAQKHLALANKECLVAAGELVKQALQKSKSVLVPVDSEHSSIFQCLLGRGQGNEIRRIVLTASGGPFWEWSLEQMKKITPEQAVRHPRWAMGAKISVDSATLMNKGLEVIEASWLFSLPGSKIEAIIHPQSVVHGFIEYEDKTVIACLYDTDMRSPISFALGYLYSEEPAMHPGTRINNNLVSPLDLGARGVLQFVNPDLERFRALKLCYQALEEGKTAPTVLNAANEIAVAAFLEHRIAFTEIALIVEETLNRYTNVALESLEDVIWADRWGRDTSQVIVKQKES